MDKNSLPAKSISFNDRPISKAEKKAARLNKSSSFSVNAVSRVPQRTFSSISAVWNLSSNSKDSDSDGKDKELRNIDEVFQEIDGLIDKLSSVEDVANLPEIPQSVEPFTKMVQTEIEKYDAGDSPLKFGLDMEQDNKLLNAVRKASKLSNLFDKFSANEKVSPFLRLTTVVVQRAMTFMEEELRIILEDSSNSFANTTPSNNEAEATNSEGKTRAEEDEGYNYPGIGEEIILNMRRIAAVMVTAGYETECCQVYSILRRNAFKEAMKQEGFEKISIDEVQKMQWESLEGHITSWIKVVKHVAKVLLPGEKRLCDSVFSDEHPSIGQAMFSNLARSAVILFLNFAEAISMTKRSAERLFKVLDIYDTLTELISSMDCLCSQDGANDLMSELSSVRRRLGEAAVCIFCDLENSIKNDVARNSVPSGAVHPLTRYTMNYLRYACDFKETLEQVFSLQHTTEQHLEALDPRRDNDHVENNSSENQHPNNEESGPKQTPFAVEMLNIMNLLDANLEAKSKLYKDPSLRFIFLMNNGRYILQKIKESAEIHELVGNNSCRKRSSELRGYHKSYQRETWSRVLQCLNQEGLQVHGKVQKPVLKERFKSFNQMFDEINKTQSCWVVSDEQLQSELRVSISAVMIPAYRSFLARFGQHFTPGRQSEKYIKYQPDDIESTIEGLFDGNQNLSISRRR